MKSIKIKNPRFSQLKMQIFFLLITTISFADEFYDDLPPEFGLDDDPPPGTPIDFLIPIVLITMFFSLWIYFYKKRFVQEQEK
jgi:hypothetical protein